MLCSALEMWKGAYHGVEKGAICELILYIALGEKQQVGKGAVSVDVKQESYFQGFEKQKDTGQLIAGVLRMAW